MKHLVSISIFLCAVVIAGLWTSCDKTTCDPAECIGNNMGCNLGRCGCIQGYEGPNCDSYSYEKFIGNYNVSETCTTGTGARNSFLYNMYISNTSRIDVITITNIHQYATVEATINNSNLVISNQSNGASSYEGQGEYFGTQRQLKLQYQYFQGSQSEQCTAIMTKL
ncbi:hypothetical protein BH09BAC1_BH09BAC1_26100 [soil metagenome]